ncbi:MAG: MATE family efflux transporter [Clostridia bacterium]|nr:MATE family efflux transporter [Lachnospiraceae bacterium]NCC01640.1 MATE family efflux transporter [Clostridia bacterium]NCD01655.1 MATE family efflux transporter [Clostridia bacterium]
MKEKQEKRYEMDMCSGPILRKMLIFTLPLVCSSILQLLFNAADIVVVGRFAGDHSLAAVGSNGALINLLTNLFIGLSVGANVLTGLCYGAKKEKDLSETVHTAMLLSVFSGIFLAIGGFFSARLILTWMQAPPEVLDLATLYLKIYFLGMPATMIYNFGSAILRAVGDTKRPLFYLSGAGVINVVLNLIFVIQFKMDVAGVATATVISECISAALVVRCLMREEGAMKLMPRKLRIHKDKLLRILRIGIPAGVQGMIFSLANVMIQSSINLFGATVVAGNSAAANIEGFVYVAMNAFHQATLSFTSQNMGAGQYKRINRILFSGQVCVLIVGLVLGNACVLFGNQLLSVYSSSAEVIGAGMNRLRVIASTYALCGMMDVMVGSLRGIGYSVLPMIVSLIGACGLRLVWLATIFQIPEFHTVQTIYISYPISWVITLAAHIICFIWARKHMKKQRKAVDE